MARPCVRRRDRRRDDRHRSLLSSPTPDGPAPRHRRGDGARHRRRTSRAERGEDGQERRRLRRPPARDGLPRDAGGDRPGRRQGQAAPEGAQVGGHVRGRTGCRPEDPERGPAPLRRRGDAPRCRGRARRMARGDRRADSPTSVARSAMWRSPTDEAVLGPEAIAAPVVVEVAVPPSTFEAVLDGETDWRALMGVGIAWVGLADPGEALAALRARVAEAGGIAPVIRGPGGLGDAPVPAHRGPPTAQGRVRPGGDPRPRPVLGRALGLSSYRA